MNNVILLNSNENTRQVEEEEQTRFVRSILEAIGLPIEEIWDEDGGLSAPNKMKLRSLLSSYSIQIVANHDGELKIYHEQKLIAQWNKPEYILKKDLAEIDPSKKLYLEMHTNFWSIFEEIEE